MRLSLLALLFAPLMTHAADIHSAPPYDSFLREYAQTRRYNNGRPVGITITPDSKHVLFLRSGPKDTVQALYAFDVDTGKTEPLLTAEQILHGASQELTVEEKARLERMRSAARGIIGYQLSEDGRFIVTSVSGKLYLVELATRKVRELHTGDGAPLDPRFSRDAKKLAYVRGGELYALDLTHDREIRLTHDAKELVTNGLPEFVAQEEMGRFAGFWWSPDGRYLAYEHADASQVEKFAIADPTHPERGAVTFPYPRPGRANAEVKLGIVPSSGGHTVWVKWDRAAYPYLATVRWPKKGPLTILVQNRTQTEEVLYAVDPKTGATKELLREHDDAWLNLDQSFPRWLENGEGFLWYTERNGGPEVELRRADGSWEASLIPPDVGFDSLLGFDDATGTAYFNGSPDATELALYRVTRGNRPERVKTDLGDVPGMVTAQLSRDGHVLVVQEASLTTAMRATVWRTDGTRIGELPSVALEPPFVPSIELRQVKAGAPEPFYAYVVRPRSFQKGRKYPVLVQVYGGPHHMEVDHNIATKLLPQWFADQGFIVVATDNRGTTNRRGRKWERIIKEDLAGVTMDDQVAVLRQLGKELPELDLSRVGIMGWSFGGYMSALALLRYPDVFKAAVAGAPVTDWRDYDTHYTERYMGLPDAQAQAYDRASLLTHADKLKGSLLLIHGTADDNVYFFHTLKFSDALFRAGRPHTVLPLSDFTHMVADPLVTERLEQRIADHLKRALMP
ncbi:MAG: alpha/beta fold hydrolase [Myxococcaceae bacterium]|nr:alpha/beta fold hydrolase [Myxococcaceae bacterium]